MLPLFALVVSHVSSFHFQNSASVTVSGDIPAASRARIEAAILAELAAQNDGSCRLAGGEEETGDAGGGEPDVRDVY